MKIINFNCSLDSLLKFFGQSVLTMYVIVINFSHAKLVCHSLLPEFQIVHEFIQKNQYGAKIVEKFAIAKLFAGLHIQQVK